MARKADQNKVYDRIGEEVNSEKCPECNEHPDCFACVDGMCTALKECGGSSCVFYKNERVAVSQSKAAYIRLKENGRSDLILKYQKTLGALGVFEEEVMKFSRTAKEMEEFSKKDYEKQLVELEDEEKLLEIIQDIVAKEESTFQQMVAEFEAEEAENNDEDDKNGEI